MPARPGVFCQPSSVIAVIPTTLAAALAVNPRARSLAARRTAFTFIAAG
jgi:flagellar motor component MotA